MSKPKGHYIARENNHTMVVWYSEGAFYKAGSAVPYTKSNFDEISENPLDLDLDNQPKVKGTRW